MGRKAWPLTITLGILVLTSVTPAVKAASVPYAILGATNNFSVAIGEMDQNYTETASGTTLDQETGNIPVITLGASGISGNPQGGLYWRAQGRYARGNTAYNGQLLNGTPAQTTTANTIFNINGRVGYARGLSRRMALIPYFEIGLQHWQRNVGSGQGAGGIEDYTNGYLGAGLLWEIALAPRWVLAFHALGGYTFGAQLAATDPVYINSAGQVFAARETKSLGDEPYTTAGVTATFRVDRMWHTFVRLNATHFSYGPSANTPIFAASGAGAPGLYEPRSKTTQVFLTIGAAARF